MSPNRRRSCPRAEHLIRWSMLNRRMDCRIKSGNDEMESLRGAAATKQSRGRWHERWIASLTLATTPLSPAVKHVVAEILHFQDRGVGAAGRRLLQMRFDHFADHDVMIALFDDGGDLAFDGARRVGENRHAGRSRLVASAALAGKSHSRPQLVE